MRLFIDDASIHEYPESMQDGSHEQLYNDPLVRALGYGPLTPRELRTALGISQPTFSRRVAGLMPVVLVTGRGPSTRYAARRTIEGVGDRVRLFEVDEHGRPRHLATLHPVRPQGHYVEAHIPLDQGGVDTGFYPDLPWFLNDLRPAGFLGRLIPRLHPELPRDITLWTGDHALAYVVRHGVDTMGAFVLGEHAVDRIAETSIPHVSTARSDRYPQLAEEVLSHGLVGSSAAGEQPKFLALRARDSTGEATMDVLTKFSPPLVGSDGQHPSRRVADLLIAEHLAHGVVASFGLPACRSEVFEAGGRVFLEVERFDRTASSLSSPRGRRGVISLASFDGGLVGRLESWSDTARELHAARRIDTPTFASIRWLQLFGRCIANTDMHHGNLSLMTRGARVDGLAPSYDMLPMAYMPQAGNVRTPPFHIPTPRHDEVAVWPEVRRAAIRFWQEVAGHADISEAFRAIASANADILER